MIRTALRRVALALAVVPLALGLAACGKRDAGADAAATSSGPIAKVPPPPGKAWSDVIAITPEGGYRMGNPDAPIKLVEYGSLTCPHCADFNHQAAEPLRTTFIDSGRVSYEFRNFVRDAIDLTASLLTRCGAPESYFALTDQVFANQESFFNNVQSAGQDAYGQAMSLPPNQRFVTLARLTGLDEFFAARGVSRGRQTACLADRAAADSLARATERQGQELGIDSTPTFIINGEKTGSATWPDLKARLEAMGAR